MTATDDKARNRALNKRLEDAEGAADRRAATDELDLVVLRQAQSRRLPTWDEVHALLDRLERAETRAMFADGREQMDSQIRTAAIEECEKGFYELIRVNPMPPDNRYVLNEEGIKMFCALKGKTDGA